MPFQSGQCHYQYTKRYCSSCGQLAEHMLEIFLNDNLSPEKPLNLYWSRTCFLFSLTYSLIQYSQLSLMAPFATATPPHTIPHYHFSSLPLTSFHTTPPSPNNYSPRPLTNPPHPSLPLTLPSPPLLTTPPHYSPHRSSSPLPLTPRP